jgi:hypothetical protein
MLGRGLPPHAVPQLKYQRHVSFGMPESTVVEPGERSAEELLSGLEDGERFVVRTEVLGSIEELTLRFDGEIYYCDSPTILHKHTDAEEMRECIEDLGFARAD